MTNVEALKNLYVALGGSAADVANLDSNAAIINILGNVAGGGGGANGFVLTENESGALDKTWKEIHDALAAGRPAVVLVDSDGLSGANLVLGVTYDTAETENPYHVATGTATYFAEAETGYPVTMS